MNFSSIRIVFLVSALLRVALIVYSDWHDARSVVKYTDVDYRVFSDATKFLLNPSLSVAKGRYGPWLGFGEYVFYILPSFPSGILSHDKAPMHERRTGIHHYWHCS
jgi:hypothetical protein